MILDELQLVPVGFLEQIIEYRAYAQTKAAYDHHQNPKAEGPLWTLVRRNETKIHADRNGLVFKEE